MNKWKTGQYLSDKAILYIDELLDLIIFSFRQLFI